jgi:hypothetical protein
MSAPDGTDTFITGAPKTGFRTTGTSGPPLPYEVRLTDWEDDRPEVRIAEGPFREPPEQSTPTVQAGTEPGAGDVVFPTYTPFPTPSNPGLFDGIAPPDMTGADSDEHVVLFCGNSYLVASNDGGAVFTDLDSTTFPGWTSLPGRSVDQVMTFLPQQRLFVWMMQHDQSPGGGDGNFRLAVARASDLANDFTTPWVRYDFTSSDVGFPKVATDRQDLSFTSNFLYMTTNLVGKGRVVIRIRLSELAALGTVNVEYTKPFEGMFQFSDLSQQNDGDLYLAAIKDNSTLRVAILRDSSTAYGTRDVPVGTFPREENLVSNDPNGADWLTRGVPNVSAVLVAGNHLWIAWDAAPSKPGSHPFFPHAHIRMAQVAIGAWTVASEHQVWNPDYAYAYATLARGSRNDIGYGVALGGPKDFPMSCFGVLGDFKVYYQDRSDVTAIVNGEPRWGDYITVRASDSTGGRQFAAFGYFTKKTPMPTGFFQTPYYLVYGRP